MAWAKDFFLEHVLSGAAYGATAVVLSHPFDTLKTRQQALGSCSALTTIGRTIKSEGVLSFYRGFFPALSGSMAFRSLPFIAYTYSTRKLNAASSWFEQHTTARACIAGASGGLLRSFVECPLEVLKVRRQVNMPWQFNYLYRGLLITALRNTSVISLFWGFADNTRHWCERLSLSAPVTSFVVGGGCSTTAWALIYPLDVIKSRVQSASATGTPGQSVTRVRVVIREMCNDRRGWRAFYAGLRAGLLRSVVANGGAFVVYDWSRKVLFEGTSQAG